VIFSLATVLYTNTARASSGGNVELKSWACLRDSR